MTMKGAFVAAAVAGMFASAIPAVSLAADTGGVKCAGANACNGKGECKSATNGCSGQNGCKGKGWITAKDEKECTAKKGKVVK
ncbi:MAG TPA: hypothetical protein VFF06_26550 [Polyangia bacterium]|nr:hypothetical protein [Polyangia bacterium]